MTEPLVQAERLVRHYTVRRGLLSGKATLRALEDVSFRLQVGQTLAVVGESGCGKSTLARQITMIETPTSGRLLIDGNDVTRASDSERRRIRRKVQIVFQDPFGSLNPRKKVSAILEEPLVINDEGDRRARANTQPEVVPIL